MFGFGYGYYTPVLILQVFCLYHAYKNQQDQKWYLLILFFPLFGGLIYLYQHFYSKRGVENFAESMKGVFDTNYNVRKLEKEYQFNNSFTNRVNLADTYMAHSRYSDALPLYEECLSGFKADDPVILKKLLYLHAQQQNHAAVIEYGNKLSDDKAFQNSQERIYYAWALHHNGDVEQAEQVFAKLDKPYSNYPHRLEYAKYLRETGKVKGAQQLLRELYNELEHMTKVEQRQYAKVRRQVKTLYKEL